MEGKGREGEGRKQGGKGRERGGVGREEAVSAPKLKLAPRTIFLALALFSRSLKK